MPGPEPFKLTFGGEGTTTGSSFRPDTGASSDSTDLATILRIVHTVMDARIGEVKAEFKAELESKLSHIENRLDGLPGTATLVGTVVGSIAVALALVFSLLSWSGDRSDTAWERSATMATTLSNLAAQTDRNARAVEDLRNQRREPAERLKQ